MDPLITHVVVDLPLSHAATQSPTPLPLPTLPVLPQLWASLLVAALPPVLLLTLL